MILHNLCDVGQILQSILRTPPNLHDTLRTRRLEYLPQAIFSDFLLLDDASNQSAVEFTITCF
jgi:hypothetical protein